jgi:short-subunit dehydrogenase
MRALITGASNGIGLELARCFAVDRYDLVLTARSEHKLETLAADLRQQYGVQVDVVVADLAKSDAVEHIVNTLAERKIEVGFLINNAGFGNFGEFASNALADELGELQVNIVALTELTHRFLPAMLERKHGRILNVASTAAFQPGPLLATYSATKAYVLSFSEALGYEIRGTGVTVTCLCPGPTVTGFGERSGFIMEEKFSKNIPSAAEVALFGYQELFAGKAVAVHGAMNRVVTMSSRLAPRSLVMQVAGKILASGRPPKADPAVEVITGTIE